MIIPNLMVADMVRSLAFYRGKLGLSLVTAVSPAREVVPETDGHDTVFVILSTADGSQLMLQTDLSLRAELPMLAPEPAFTGTVYIRGSDPRPIFARMTAEEVVKPVERQWYGMLEGYVRDPDGYVICLGMADGPPHD